MIDRYLLITSKIEAASGSTVDPYDVAGISSTKLSNLTLSRYVTFKLDMSSYMYARVAWMDNLHPASMDLSTWHTCWLHTFLHCISLGAVCCTTRRLS